MGDLQRVDDLPGSFGYGSGVLYGLPQPPRWMGQVNPDLQKVILLLDSGDLLFGHLTGLDWEGGNVILRAGEETHSIPSATCAAYCSAPTPKAAPWRRRARSPAP
ncbi:glycosyltransferase family 2 protein [Arenimonas daejeonensis]|uniref:glycosyltransferase family 2 protein n=1 Tax=Arenimonas daejeonensis TaxID=370777 RepID=UPI0011BD461A|nr:glycosyltransferase family 2 protein [Arenimonas daejeonensis]